jgi:hypothetical protein
VPLEHKQEAGLRSMKTIPIKSDSSAANVHCGKMSPLSCATLTTLCSARKESAQEK